MTRQPDFTNAEYRQAAFSRVFSTPEGKEVLAWLSKMTYIGVPNFECSNRVYYDLGRRSIINYINETLTYERKPVCPKI